MIILSRLILVCLSVLFIILMDILEKFGIYPWFVFSFLSSEFMLHICWYFSAECLNLLRARIVLFSVLLIQCSIRIRTVSLNTLLTWVNLWLCTCLFLIWWGGKELRKWNVIFHLQTSSLCILLHLFTLDHAYNKLYYNDKVELVFFHLIMLEVILMKLSQLYFLWILQWQWYAMEKKFYCRWLDNTSFLLIRPWISPILPTPHHLFPFW